MGCKQGGLLQAGGLAATLGSCRDVLAQNLFFVLGKLDELDAHVFGFIVIGPHHFAFHFNDFVEGGEIDGDEDLGAKGLRGGRPEAQSAQAEIFDLVKQEYFGACVVYQCICFNSDVLSLLVICHSHPPISTLRSRLTHRGIPVKRDSRSEKGNRIQIGLTWAIRRDPTDSKQVGTMTTVTSMSCATFIATSGSTP